MKAATLIGIIIATVGLLGGAFLEGTKPMALFNVPAIVIVIGGTLGVCLASVGMESMKRVPALIKMSFNVEPSDPGPKGGGIVRNTQRPPPHGERAQEEELEAIHDE
jgi:chemotaxis protein MotA